jgi:two-component system phosphate regulon sensor histidine kinase PhoR
MTAEIYGARVRTKSLTMTFDVPDALPEVIGNDEQIERVVANLVDNAVKFTPDGGSVSIGLEECDHEGREGVLLRVADTGIGIPSSELVRVFDRFHQVDPSIRRRFGGMGLGLSLVQHIVESHRGVVWAESEVGEGSTFFVWFPCQRDAAGEGSGQRAAL